MELQSFNLHTHTVRCGHAEGHDEQYVTNAIASGFTLLGFSDHVPFVGQRMPGDRMLYEQKDEYMSSIRTLQQKYRKEIDIRIGYEVEFFEDQADYLLQLRKSCDYMILGQHCKYMWYEYDAHDSDEDVLEYARQVECALEADFITYVAHPDYFLLGRTAYSKACVEAAHRIAKASAAHDIPLEINLNGFRYGKRSYRMPDGREDRYPYPFREFWETASSYGCKVFYGYDAHTPSTLQDRNRESMASEILQGLPLRFVTDVVPIIR